MWRNSVYGDARQRRLGFAWKLTAICRETTPNALELGSNVTNNCEKPTVCCNAIPGAIRRLAGLGSHRKNRVQRHAHRWDASRAAIGLISYPGRAALSNKAWRHSSINRLCNAQRSRRGVGEKGVASPPERTSRWVLPYGRPIVGRLSRYDLARCRGVVED